MRRAGLALQVVPLKELSLEALSRHDGSDASLPLYLAIKGTVYDITKGSMFYGPDGALHVVWCINFIIIDVSTVNGRVGIYTLR